LTRISHINLQAIRQFPEQGRVQQGSFGKSLLCMIFVFLFGANAVFAQSDEVAGPVAQITENAKNIESTIRILNRISAASDLDDEALVGARVKYQSVINSSQEIIRFIDEESKAIADNLTAIGPPPEADTIVEAPAVTETRARLNQERSSLAVTKTQIEKFIQSAQSAIASITQARQEAFKEAISKRTSITSDMLSEASGGLYSLYKSGIISFRDWFAFVVANKFWPALGSAFISLAAALFLSFNFNRFFGNYLIRNAPDPDYFTRVFTAFWGIVLPSAATALFLAFAYGLFYQYSIFNKQIGEIVFTLFLVIAGLVFSWNFCKAVFSPNAANWRLIDLPDILAKRQFWLTFALAVIYAFDNLFTSVNSALSGALSLTVLQGIVSALLIGFILVLMAQVIHRRRYYDQHDDEQIGKKRYRFDRWVAFALGLSALTIISASLLGYIGFARFFAQQIVVTGGIVAIMSVGIIAARELSREGVMATTGFGRAMLQRGHEPYKVEQVALVGGMALIASVLIIGVPSIFMQWGTRFEEIQAFAFTAFSGFTIGGIRLSLSGLFIGILVFGVILAFTRLIQGWLSRSVFPRSKIDPGVSDSIRAGIGYTGFAIAGLMAVTSAGLDLSSLAIVAGALSLGIGFGLQNIVSNFVSGLILLVERPIKVGDWITVGGAEGFVKRISVRATEIETFQKQSIIVPNSELINSQVSNWTFKAKNGRCDILIGVAYGSDVRLVETILYDIANNHAMVQKKPEPKVWFLDFGASSLDFRVQMFLYDITNVAIVGSEVRFEILRRFEEAGIEIPFPQSDVNLRVIDVPKNQIEGAIAKTAPKAKKTKAPARVKKHNPNTTQPG